ncbi:transposase [Streptomyces sp. NPDC055722]
MGVDSPHLPIGRYGPYPEHLCDQMEWIIWRFRTGSPWRDVPEAFGSWSGYVVCSGSGWLGWIAGQARAS